MNHKFRNMLNLLLLCCFALLSATAVFADNDNQPICHVPPGNPAAAHIIYPDDSSYDAHVAHGDFIVDAENPCPPQNEQEDVCPNIEGDQASLPDGYHFDDAGNCVENEEPVDVCDNLDGNQASVPDGYYQDGTSCSPEEE